MENKITVLSLASALSQATGKTKKLCEDFIREYFKVVAECMDKGEVLKVKGFGTFKVVDVEARSGVNVNTGQRQDFPAYKKVVFTPSKEFAQTINAPFEEFESVELEEEISEDLLYEDISEENVSDENAVSDPILEAGSEEEGEDDDITAEAYNAIEAETVEAQNAVEAETAEDQPETIDDVPETASQPETASEVESQEEPSAESYSQEEPSAEVVSQPEPTQERVVEEYYYETPAKSRFGIGFLTGALSALVVCVVVFLLGCFFDWWPENFGRGKAVESEQPIAEVVEQPQEEEVEEEVADEPVYDTVSTTRYLTTIAREHYGDFNFWPYIYIENQSKLGHPDRIIPGTQVVVPDLKKYGVDTKNPQDVEKAKAEGKKIYARYTKK